MELTDSACRADSNTALSAVERSSVPILKAAASVCATSSQVRIIILQKSVRASFWKNQSVRVSTACLLAILEAEAGSSVQAGRQPHASGVGTAGNAARRRQPSQHLKQTSPEHSNSDYMEARTTIASLHTQEFICTKHQRASTSASTERGSAFD